MSYFIRVGLHIVLLKGQSTKSKSWLRGYIFQKLLLVWNFSCINKKCFLIKEMDTFGHIVIWTVYTAHIDHFTPKHTAFGQSAACLSVFLESLPGLIQFAILWHAGWTLEKNSCMNMNYNYLTTIFRSIFAQMYKFLVEKYIFTIFAFELFKVKIIPEINIFGQKLYVGE